MKSKGGALRVFMAFLWSMSTFTFSIALGQESNDYASAMQMLQLVNNVRIQRNIRPLCLSNKLVRAATAHSAYQSSITTMTHDGPLSLGDRFIRQGYQPSAVAENVGFTSTPFAQVVFDIWMSSPEHRANIIDPNYAHFGSASALGSNSMYFWTQLFAKPMSLAMEPCDFNAAGAAATLTPGLPGFNPNGIYGGHGNKNINAYTPGMPPNGNCVTIDNGSGGKTLNCRMAGPAGGPNSIQYRNSFSGAGSNSNSIANPPGYDGTTCTVVSTAPAADGQGSVRVFKCRSNSPAVGAPQYNPNIAPSTPSPYLNTGSDGSAIIVNPDVPAGYNNPSGMNIVDGNPPVYNQVGTNPPGYNQPGYNSPGYNPPGYNPPGYNPPGYNPPGYNPPGYNPPGYNPPNYNPVGSNPPGYNPPGYNQVGSSNPSGQQPFWA